MAAVVLLLTSAAGSPADFSSDGAVGGFGVLFGAALEGAFGFSSGSAAGSGSDGAADACGAGSDGSTTSSGADKLDVSGIMAAFPLALSMGITTWFAV